MSKFSRNLRFHRIRAGYTQEAMSRLLHVTRQTYANYECSLREPSLSTLMDMSQILQVTIDALIHPFTKSQARISMEIERKYLLKKLPDNLNTYNCHEIEQGYLCTEPVIRIRRQDDEYFLTYKSKGLMVREEYNLPLNKTAYEQLRPKIEGLLLSKTRYLIPYGQIYTIELDVFHDAYEGLYLAEVEFPSEEEANEFIPPSWFGEDVTFSSKYHNSTMSKKII